jgi:hypothetical protein
MEPVQPARRHASLNLHLRGTEGEQLRPVDHAVLAARQPPDRSIDLAIGP